MLLLPLHALADDAWVLVNTGQETVSVVKDGQKVLTFKGAAFGRGGIGAVRQRGDGQTPQGSYRIAWINHNSQYHVFFGLNYPTLTQALTGFNKGIIDKNSFDKIAQADIDGILPPQDTPLGGNIGIHGVGKGSLWMHKNFNWTDGCIALTNQQIEKLAPWLEIGTRVVIK